MINVQRTIADQWVTVSVTPAPTGWRNVFGGRDLQEPLEEMTRLAPFARPCPAFLLQEHRGTLRAAEDGVQSEIQYEPPYATRVVCATLGAFGELEPAEDVLNYLGPLAPGEDLEQRYSSTAVEDYV